MVITLNNGKTVSVPFDQWIDMSDYELKNFMDSESGDEINDPFFQSAIDNPRSRHSDEDMDDDE